MLYLSHMLSIHKAIRLFKNNITSDSDKSSASVIYTCPFDRAVLLLCFSSSVPKITDPVRHTSRSLPCGLVTLTCPLRPTSVFREGRKLVPMQVFFLPVDPGASEESRSQGGVRRAGDRDLYTSRSSCDFENVIFVLNECLL